MRDFDLADTAKEVCDEDFVRVSLEEIPPHAHCGDTLSSWTRLKLWDTWQSMTRRWTESSHVWFIQKAKNCFGGQRFWNISCHSGNTNKDRHTLSLPLFPLCQGWCAARNFFTASSDSLFHPPLPLVFFFQSSSSPVFLTSLFTQSSHLSLGHPRLLLPSSRNSAALFGSLSPAILSTCPAHCSLLLTSLSVKIHCFCGHAWGYERERKRERGGSRSGSRREREIEREIIIIIFICIAPYIRN